MLVTFDILDLTAKKEPITFVSSEHIKTISRNPKTKTSRL